MKRNKKAKDELGRLLGKFISIGISSLTREEDGLLNMLEKVEQDRMLSWFSAHYDLGGLSLRQFLKYNSRQEMGDVDLVDFLHDVFPEPSGLASELLARAIKAKKEFFAEEERIVAGRAVTEDTVAAAFRESVPPPAHQRQETRSFEAKPLSPPVAVHRAPPPASRAPAAASSVEPTTHHTIQPGYPPPTEKQRRPLADQLDEALGKPPDAMVNTAPEGYVPGALVETVRDLTAAEEEFQRDMEESGAHSLPASPILDAILAQDTWKGMGGDSGLGELPAPTGAVAEEFKAPEAPSESLKRDSDGRGIGIYIGLKSDDARIHEELENEIVSANGGSEPLTLEDAMTEDEHDDPAEDAEAEERTTQEVAPEQVVETTQVSPAPKPDADVFTSVKADEKVDESAPAEPKSEPSAVPVGSPVTEMPEPKPEEKSLADVVGDKLAEVEPVPVVPPMVSLPEEQQPQQLRIPTMELPIPAALRPEAPSLPCEQVVPAATPASVKAVEVEDAQHKLGTDPTMSSIVTQTPMPELPLPKTFRVKDEVKTRQGFPPPPAESPNETKPASAIVVPASQDDANKLPPTLSPNLRKSHPALMRVALFLLIFLAVVTGVLALVGKDTLMLGLAGPPEVVVKKKPATIVAETFLPPCAEGDQERAINRLREFAEGKMIPTALTDCYPSSNSGQCATLLPARLVYKCCSRIAESPAVGDNDPLGESLRCGATTASFLFSRAEREPAP